MGVFERIAETAGHEQVLFCNDPDVGLKAIIAIHNTTLGPALGGLRMWNYENEEEALVDVLRLSRGMTYKAAVAGLNLGGGKAVIIGDPKTQRSEALFRAFGRHVQALNGRYITAEDVGTSVEVMGWIHMETDHVVGLDQDLGGSGDPSPVTALGTFAGIKACLEAKFGSDDPKGRTVAIQGFGHVGYYLGKYLHEAGAKLVVCDINKNSTDIAAAEFGAEVVSTDAFYDLDVDVLSPCALGGGVNDDTIDRIKAPIIAGAANNQLKDESVHGKLLNKKGIIYAPDYVINAGGLINVYAEIQKHPRERALKHARQIQGVVSNILATAKREGITSVEAARHEAEERLRLGSHLRQFHLNGRR